MFNSLLDKYWFWFISQVSVSSCMAFYEQLAEAKNVLDHQREPAVVFDSGHLVTL